MIFSAKLRTGHEERARKLQQTMASAPKGSDGRLHPNKVLSELQQAIGNDSVIITDGGGRKSPAWLTIGAWRSAPLGCRVRSAAKKNLRAPPSHLGAIAGEVVHNEPAFPRCKVPGRLKPMAISRCPRRSNGHTAQILFRWGNGVTPTKARSPSSGASALTGRCK